MNLSEEKKYIKRRLNEIPGGARSLNLVYWPQDNPTSAQLVKLKEYVESLGCVVTVVDGFSWPKGLAITNLLTHNR